MSNKPTIQMLRTQQQNWRLQKAIDQFMEQIEHLKNLNQQHEKQIESLLKFNERLLTIIEEQVNNNQSRMNERSLQPISEVTEVDSQAMQQMMQSLQKTRNKLAARSEKNGGLYKSHLEVKGNFLQVVNNSNTNNVYQYMNEMKDLERSQRFVTVDRDHSQFGNKSSFSKKRQKKFNYEKVDFDPKPVDKSLSIDQMHRTSTQTKPFVIRQVLVTDPQQESRIKQQESYWMQQEIKKKMTQQVEEMRKNSQMNGDFFDKKIDQLNKLSKQVVYDPEKKFKELQGKIQLSPHLAALVKKAMVKGK